jgi:hypothetical protein
VARPRRFFRKGPDGQGSGNGVLSGGGKRRLGQMTKIDQGQEEIRQEDDKAKEGQPGWLPVDQSSFGVVLHPRLSGKRLKTPSVAFR